MWIFIHLLLVGAVSELGCCLSLPPCVPQYTLLAFPRRVQGAHHSFLGPLLLNAQYFIRLQFPLGYNFMRIMRYYGTQSSRVAGLAVARVSKADERHEHRARLIFGMSIITR